MTVATWEVEIYGYTPATFRASTRRKATYRAFLAFRDGVTRLSFRDFLARGVSVRQLAESEATISGAIGG